MATQDSVILTIDQGTTSSRAILFDTHGHPIKQFQHEFSQYFPQPGWVEHKPDDIWNTVLSTSREALACAASLRLRVAGIGITNQRETTVVWDRETGEPIYNAIVWQDRRTAKHCEQLATQGALAQVRNKTGLLLDPYFSASKLAWILDHVEGARTAAQKGRLAFGTIDSFLIWRLTRGRSHVTDATNASRTQLFNIHTQRWDDDLLTLFNVPFEVLPEVLDCVADFGVTDVDVLGDAIPILGVAGDQQAAAIGQACFDMGESKSTYGTGCFVLVNTGSKAIMSDHKLLTTIAYRIGNEVSYALEGSIFIAGAAIQWLRDGLGIIQHAHETETLAASIDDNHGVYLVPAFTGLGAPYWDADARGALFGLTRASGKAELARAALESVCYQTADLMAAINKDGMTISRLKVDGGMVANNWLIQCLADTLNMTIERPSVLETTARGVTYLVALKLGIFNNLDDIRSQWKMDASVTPQIPSVERERRLAGWRNAVQRTLTRHHDH